MGRMDLKTYISGLSPDERQALALRCDTSVGHLQNVMYGYKPCGIELAVALEQRSGGAVTRRDLRPDDWQRIWPELSATAA
jgi:DNA-binding transcriptional regulator YdaS (Cro superfamily)